MLSKVKSKSYKDKKILISWNLSDARDKLKSAKSNQQISEESAS